MVAIAAAVLVAFIGGLYFITHHKKEESESLQNQKVTGNGLPPKPEERWRYIKELESRQPGVRAPTEPTAGGEVQKPEQLTDEQRQLLAQMQADMRQQPTQLSEVPWNEQTAEQRQLFFMMKDPKAGSLQNHSVYQLRQHIFIVPSLYNNRLFDPQHISPTCGRHSRCTSRPQGFRYTALLVWPSLARAG